MLVSEALTHAVNEYFDNPGTSADFITPNMGIYWVNKAIRHYWRWMAQQEFGYFQIREATIAVTANTAVYAMPNASTTTNTTSSSVAFVSNVFLRTGSAAPFTYLRIFPTYPNDRFYLKMSNLMFPVASILQNQSGFTWSGNVGNLDGSGNPTWNIEFSPTPSVAMTVIYDGYRYPAKAAATTDSIDLPEHMQDGIVLHVLRDCYIRDKADTKDIDKRILDFDNEIIQFEKQGVQRDGPLVVKEVR